MREAPSAPPVLARLAALLAAGAVMAALAQGKPAERRVALVIGNAAYPSAALRNPVNDATAIAARLRALGFDVALRTNVTQREMTRAVSQFGQGLKPGSVAFFYYAGHGMQVRGRNFLIPVDAEIETEASVRSEAVDLDLVLEQLGPARLSMIILDACRNNPFEGRFRAARGSGLAQVDAPKGTLLAYATAPGKVASDGEGAHGLYTAELLKAMDVPGIKVEEAFKIVRVNVIKATAGEQIPWESSSLTGDYYFKPVDKAAQQAKAAREAASKQAEMQARLDTERRQREADARALKEEMEKLREEVKRLSASAAPAATKPAPAATKPAPAAAKPATGPAKPGPAAAKTEAPARKETKPPTAPGPVAAAGAAPRPADNASAEWARRLETLAGQRGKLTLPKAVAILFEPLGDAQLTALVEKERALRDMPYHSAFAIGITAAGNLAHHRHGREITPLLARETAAERCGRVSRSPCSVVMMNGEFQEAAFLDWARGAQGASPARLREGFLKMRVN